MKVEIPLRISSPGNAANKNPIVQARERKRQRLIVSRVLALGGYVKPSLPCRVTFTRVGKKYLDDDNLASSFKSIRDEVAKWLGCGDGPKDPIKWFYDQKIGEYAVKIEIEEVIE